MQVKYDNSFFPPADTVVHNWLNDWERGVRQGGQNTVPLYLNSAVESINELFPRGWRLTADYIENIIDSRSFYTKAACTHEDDLTFWTVDLDAVQARSDRWKERLSNRARG